MTWNMPQAPRTITATKRVSTGVSGRTAQDAPLADEKARERMASPIQRCQGQYVDSKGIRLDGCGAPNRAVCTCRSSRKASAPRKPSSKPTTRRLDPEVIHQTRVIEYMMKIARMPESMRLNALSDVPLKFRADVKAELEL